MDWKTSSWASDAELPIQLELDLGSPKTFDVIELREDLKLGQRIAAFHVQVELDGVWQEFGSGYTVGYKRLLRGSVVEAAEDTRDHYRGTGFAFVDQDFTL